MWLFFVPETKNEIEGKAGRHYFEHLEDFDRSYFDQLKGRFSVEFSKAVVNIVFLLREGM